MKKQVYGLLAAAALLAALVSGCGNKKAEQEAGQTTKTAQESTTQVSSGTAEEDPVYAVAGIRMDEAETFIQTFVSHLKAGEKAEAAEMILYPRKVTVPDGDLIVDDAEEFLDYYDDIFTEDFIAKLEEDSKKDLNYNDQGVWIGDGELWVMTADKKLYINSIFNADDRSVKYDGEPGIQPG
ncbi:MAG: hypothetical protein KH366_09720 [Clostridiaceae bacterium]|nr:hypothetical protein [Clostridiaceae bacterium]